MKEIKLSLLLLLSTTLLFAQNNKTNFEITTRVQNYTKCKVSETSEFKFENGQASLQKDGASWKCNETKRVLENCVEVNYTFKLVSGQSATTGVVVNFTFNDWSADNYVIMPGAVYNGNRFEVLKYNYPPLFKKEDYIVDCPITITDVPRLNKYEGKSRLDLNTGDLTTPAIGIYFPKTKKGIWIFTEQATELGNSVLTLKENADRTKAEFAISAPCVRELIYGMTHLSESDETGIDWKTGDKATIDAKFMNSIVLTHHLN